MKKLEEEVKQFRKLALLEATSTASSGSYEQPLEFEIERPQEDFIGLSISDEAPEVSIVDITGGDVGGFEEITLDSEDMDTEEESDDSEDILTLMNTLGLGL